jgi:flagellar basal body rod protein FlgG
MANLITSSRMFEANQKVIQSEDERMAKLIADVGNPT